MLMGGELKDNGTDGAGEMPWRNYIIVSQSVKVEII